MKIDKRYSGLLNALIMAIILPFFMTLVVTLVNMGFDPGILGPWMRTWAIASTAALPLILVLAPAIRKVVVSVTE